MKTTVNGINLAYDDTGAGEPVILLHGFPLNRKMWQPQLDPLREAGYRVIAPDLRGFGDSDSPPGPYSMGLLADDTVALMNRLDLDRAVVGGMSMGGYILLNLLERYPDRIRAACFITTKSEADDVPAKMRRVEAAGKVMNEGAGVVAGQFGTLLFSERTLRENPFLVSEVRRWMEQTSPEGLSGALLAMSERRDYTGMLDTLRAPSAVIAGECDKAVSRESTDRLAAGLPNSTLCLIPNAGHMANMERPAEFNKCLLQFLRTLT
jgi:pimeloyl-ACP methyl ester carboxylesterase